MRPIVGGPIVGMNIFLKIMNIKEKIGITIKKRREEKAYSIEYLANISHVDRNYISDIEKGQRNVSITVLEKIIIALELDFAAFFSDKNFMKK